MRPQWPHWHLDAFIDQPESDLAGAAKFRELPERQVKRLANPLVGIKFQTVVEAAVEVAAGGLEAQGFLRALSQNRQLQLAERSLHAEQQPVINLLRVINAILVNDQAMNKGAKLQKRVPITAIASKPGSFDVLRPDIWIRDCIMPRA